MLPWIISAGFFLTAVGLFVKIRMMQKGTDEIRKIFRDPQVRTAALPKSRTKAENCLQESFRRFRRSSFRN